MNVTMLRYKHREYIDKVELIAAIRKIALETPNSIQRKALSEVGDWLEKMELDESRLHAM